ncbi:MAG TPA: hypothetical protein VNW71_15785 [Thermoanaerobaculia bacterium]|nr:hypothetical protein [Thermoanaerobaculia bacterium]
MDHDYIQEHQVVDRYVQGRLPEAEADLFEDHYLTCEECLRRLRIAEKFQRGFRQVAAEEATGAVGILAAFLRSRRGLLLGSVLAVLLAASALLAVHSVRLGRDLDEARARLAQTRAEEEGREAAARSEAESLRARLAEEREARSRMEEEAGRPRLPQAARAAGAWIVTLVPVRSGPAGEPSQRITLPPTPQWIVLALDLELDASGTFRAVLERQGGGAVWTGEGLRPSPQGELAVGLDSSLLAPGDYRFRVEQGDGVPVARIAFRAGM